MTNESWKNEQFDELRHKVGALDWILRNYDWSPTHAEAIEEAREILDRIVDEYDNIK